MNEQCEKKPQTAWNQDSNSIFCAESTHKKMSEILGKFGLPSWILTDSYDKKRKCPYCGTDFVMESVRGVGVCLNAQHFGDIQIEILCQNCYSSYFLQFRKECRTILDFSKSLLEERSMSNHPVLLSDIKPSENNLSDLLILDEQNKHLSPKTEQN